MIGSYINRTYHSELMAPCIHIHTVINNFKVNFIYR